MKKKSRRAKRNAKTLLVGRDPAKGRLAFKTGRVESAVDKNRRRNSKTARNEYRHQCDHSPEKGA